MYVELLTLLRHQTWVALAAVSLCSCTAMSARVEPESSGGVMLGSHPIDALAVLPPAGILQIADSGAIDGSHGDESQLVDFRAPTTGTIRNASPSEYVPPRETSAPASAVQPTSPPATPASHTESPTSSATRQPRPVVPAHPVGPAAGEASFTPAVPRIAVDHGGPERWPDEYLFDGGDRALPVHYDDFHRLGLDTEDTIAEFTDHRGGRHMRPSNRVAVYAPRFAAVRTLGIPQSHVAVDRLAGARERTRGVGALQRVGTAYHRRDIAGSGFVVRSRASGFDVDQTTAHASQTTRLLEHDKLLNVYQNVAFLRTGKLDRAEGAWLAKRIEAAFAWSQDQSPVITAKVDGVRQIEALVREDSFVGIGDEATDGELRIVKLADHRIAEAGDIVTFTIRFDNLGDQAVHHVRIVDNLTPRLEYVDDSADSDRPGRLVVEDNGEGSLVLKFEVAEPIPGHEGGVVTFRARVQ